MAGEFHKKCKIKKVGALRGICKVDCGKPCKIMRVGTLRGRLQKKNAKLRGLGH